MKLWNRLLASINPEVRQLREDIINLTADLYEARHRAQEAVNVASLLKRTNVQLASKLERLELLRGNEGTSNE
jgi:hypothetical protein